LAQGAKVEALLRFQDSLLLMENDAVSKDIMRLTQEIAEEKERIAEARGLREKGYTLVDGKHYSEALEYFARSLTLHADPYLAAYMDTLREWADREKVARVEASRLRGEGDALMKDKKTAEALVKYKESLQVWHDDELAATVKKEEDRIAEAKAAQLRKEAETLVRQKKTADALAKYKESLTYAHNDAAADYVKKTEAAEAKRRADALIKEGDALVKQKKPDEALERYRLAQKDAPDNETLAATIRKLELALAPAVAEAPLAENGSLPEPSRDENTSSDQGDTRDLVQADALFKEGNSLYRQRKYREALQRYRESYKLSQSQKLLDFANQLESTLENVEKANTLVQEANALYKAQKYNEALARYKESLSFHANSEVEAFILKVEALLR
jgi:tetratricopeptide (TPR) repeat protein